MRRGSKRSANSGFAICGYRWVNAVIRHALCILMEREILFSRWRRCAAPGPTESVRSSASLVDASAEAEQKPNVSRLGATAPSIALHADMFARTPSPC